MRPSGPYIVSEGSTYYQNRVYLSLDTISASDECGYVGTQHTGAVLTVQSSELHSVAGYHHDFEDIGYKVTFQDFETVPAYAYYVNDNNVGPSYERPDRYRFQTDFLNGMSTVDFGGIMAGGRGYSAMSVSWIWDQAYAPKLLMPLQVRHLDSAWYIYCPPTQ